MRLLSSSTDLPDLCSLSSWVLAASSLLGALTLVYGEPAVRWASIESERPEETEERIEAGRYLFERHCLRCHGERGRGDGPYAAELSNKPRDFALGIFKARTTSGKEFPSDLDFFRTITAGFPAYDMPSFIELPEADRWALVFYLKTVIERSMKARLIDMARERGEPIGEAEIGRIVREKMKPGHVVRIPEERKGSLAASIRRGKLLFIKSDYQCANCHGHEGKGNGPRAASMKDDWGRLIVPRDMTQVPAKMKFGSAPEDTVRLILIGIPGTPMPSFEYAATFDEGIQEIWDIARFVESLRKSE